MSNHTDNYIGGKSLKIKCSTCEKIFHVRFDFRRYHRINVNFPGKILHLPSRKELSNVVVISLSINGVGFIMSNNDILNRSYIYDLVFHLDDDNHSIICEEIVIKRVNGLFVGAEFYYNDRYNYELDFYITSEPGSA